MMSSARSWSLSGRACPGSASRAVLRDVDDRIVVEAAVAGAADAIETGDKDLLDDADLVAWLPDRGISVITPSDLLELLEESSWRPS